MDFSEDIKRIETTLTAYLPDCTGELSFVPDILAYSLEGGSKRVRPLLCLSFCRLCGGDPEAALLFAAAVEYVHTYSLIHDDLPCMDDDDFRRGKLSSHRKFGEANAVLAGDALLTHAFYLLTLSSSEGRISPAAALRAVRELSFLAGVNGMVGGQYLDLAFEKKHASADVLFTMDELKTGALIKAACVLGCIAADAPETHIEAAGCFAENLGLAFQLTDDILEYESGEISSDEKKEKSTYITLCGLQETKRLASDYTVKAIAALEPFGASADDIRGIARMLLHRKN
ncbi:MAG: polyprenyl synthetase family protein [Clostridia bacterium]|nr:polyprenyl synthetase family protein [Clostridia bacterium]